MNNELIEKEIWKTIEEAPNYAVSNFGRIKNQMTNHVLKPWNCKNGYQQVSLKVIGYDKFQKRYVHRVVAQAFIPNIENKREVNHIDGNKTNNKLSNLEWVTSSENQIKRHELGNNKTSHRRIGRFSLNGELIEEYESIVQAAQDMRVTRNAIDCAVHKKHKTSCGFVWNFLD